MEIRRFTELTTSDLAASASVGDAVDYLDLVFAVRRHDGKVDLACRAAVLLGLLTEYRNGTWPVVRAYFPSDSFAQVRHIEARESCGASSQLLAGYAFQEIAHGSWADAAARVRNLFPGLQATTSSETHIPRRWSLGTEQ